ncbi:MAG TPA: recombinase family protein [Candidatus Saccharimonadia bacterium]|nr:recombinase family protein [Candidatus Saccharimonadia bacterium]
MAAGDSHRQRTAAGRQPRARKRQPSAATTAVAAPFQASPQILGTYNPVAAAARIQTLHRQGMRFARIADALTVEGIPTRHGLPWQQSSVRHVLKTYGQ